MAPELEVVGKSPLKAREDASTASTATGGFSSSASMSTASFSLPSLDEESLCSFPGTMNQLFFRPRRPLVFRSRRPRLQDSRNVFGCLEQELWPNRKVTSYQQSYGRPKSAPRLRPANTQPANRLGVVSARPRPKSACSAPPSVARPLSSPPVSELGSLPLSDVSLSMSRSMSLSATSPSAAPGTSDVELTSLASSKGKENQPISCASQCRFRSRVRHVGCMSWIE